MSAILWILIMSGCPESSKNKHFDTTLDTGVECEKQEDITVTSIRPHIADPLTSMCSYEYGVVSPEGDAVAIKSLYCPETLDGEGNIFIYSFPDLELKLKIQGSYPDEFVGRVSTVIGQVDGVGTGPLVAFNWIERNAYPGTLYGGADLYDINTGTLLTRIHSLNSWPGKNITFLNDFWVLTDPNVNQIQLYDLHNLESETTPSAAIAIQSWSEERPYNTLHSIGDADGDGLNDLLLGEAASYWFLSQEDAVYDQGIANAIYLPVRNTDAELSAPVSTPDWDGDGLEDIAIRDNSQTPPGDIRIISPLSQWPLATYITSDAEDLGMHLARIDGFSGEGQEGLIVDKSINYIEPTDYYLLSPGGCGTIEIENVGDVLIQDELPTGYSTMWGQGQLLMFFPKQSGENTEHPIYLLTPGE